MGRETTARYWCDGCGKKHERKELRKFTLTEAKMGGEFVGEAVTELCTDCERKLHEAASDLFPAVEWEALKGIVR